MATPACWASCPICMSRAPDWIPAVCGLDHGPESSLSRSLSVVAGRLPKSLRGLSGRMSMRKTFPSRMPYSRFVYCKAPLKGTSGSRKPLLACHRRTALRTTAAGIGTALHLAVVVHAVTGVGALTADLRTRAAGNRVNGSAAQHGVCAGGADVCTRRPQADVLGRSEEHTSEPQSLMRISYAVLCFKKKQ